MFLDNLAVSVLFICDELKLTYGSASERCNLGERYFGDIARKRTAPTILTLEKLCIGLNRTPNELLMRPPIVETRAFREPMLIQQIRCYSGLNGLTCFPVCPRCGVTLEREYQAFCDRCGQCLGWENLRKAEMILPPQ